MLLESGEQIEAEEFLVSQSQRSRGCHQASGSLGGISVAEVRGLAGLYRLNDFLRGAATGGSCVWWKWPL